MSVIYTAVVLGATATTAGGQDTPLAHVIPDRGTWAAVTTADPPAHARGGFWRPATARSPDGGTAFTWHAGSRSVLAAPVTADGTPVAPAAPYCPLRVPPGQEPEVTALAADAAGRVFAATPAGVQVFDPTGRLSGVLTPPPGGRVDALWFDGQTLLARSGGQTVARPVRVPGR